ncbi:MULTISPECIES: hypothetical protein [Thioalkalivibrio]|uniref:Uncharacterized protein n=1 Tax=Thioalkalivibrio versutus TaxID=106634 RepID=A0A0G3G512_9GAMM|nr:MULTISPECIES: hypothetical protein [Thioalkalivibrio]AKJ95459.1 hypothetical protein TVD_08870 [Thioalkalivibrio versutus]
MLDLLRSRSTYSDQRFQFSLLVLATGFVLTLQNPQAQESAAELFSKVEFPNFAQVQDMRPQLPPPWMEGDQLVNEDSESVPVVTLLEREDARSADPRERPTRAAGAE